MCWKANSVQLKSLKHSNAASFVSAQSLGESPALKLAFWKQLIQWLFKYESDATGADCQKICALIQGMEASHLQERVYGCPSEAFVVPRGRPELGQEWSSANRVSFYSLVCAKVTLHFSGLKHGL